MTNPMIVFLLAFACNVLFLATLVAFVVWRKTNVFEQRLWVVRKSQIATILANDKKFIGHSKVLSSVSKLATGSCVDDELVIQVAGYPPVHINLSSPPRIRDLFIEGSANRIAYNAFEIQQECIKLYDTTGDDRLLDLFWSAWIQI